MLPSSGCWPDKLGPEEMKAGGQLRHIAKHGVGTNDIDKCGSPPRSAFRSRCRRQAATVTRLPNTRWRCIMTSLLTCRGRMRYIRDGIWEPRTSIKVELRGQTLGIVGFAVDRPDARRWPARSAWRLSPSIRIRRKARLPEAFAASNRPGQAARFIGTSSACTVLANETDKLIDAYAGSRL